MYTVTQKYFSIRTRDLMFDSISWLIIDESVNYLLIVTAQLQIFLSGLVSVLLCDASARKLVAFYV